MDANEIYNPWSPPYLSYNCFFVVMEVSGSELRLWKVSRMDMGAYMCIAKNGVPPAVSKRIQLGIDCKFDLYKVLHILKFGCINI